MKNFTTNINSENSTLTWMPQCDLGIIDDNINIWKGCMNFNVDTHKDFCTLIKEDLHYFETSQVKRMNKIKKKILNNNCWYMKQDLLVKFINLLILEQENLKNCFGIASPWLKGIFHSNEISNKISCECNDITKPEKQIKYFYNLDDDEIDFSCIRTKNINENLIDNFPILKNL